MKDTLLPAVDRVLRRRRYVHGLVRHGAMRDARQRRLHQIPDPDRLPRSRSRRCQGELGGDRHCCPAARSSCSTCRVAERPARADDSGGGGRQPGVEQALVGAAGLDQVVVMAVLDRRPPSSTSTRSARAAVDKRCAMAIVVRPVASLASARDVRTSVSASTDDVASSSTNTSGSAIPARSRATS